MIKHITQAHNAFTFGALAIEGALCYDRDILIWKVIPLNVNICDDITRLACKEAYEIYRDCLYRPTPERYLNELRAYAGDPGVVILTVEDADALAGLIVLKREGRAAEILGIAVRQDLRLRGYGRALVEGAAQTLDLMWLFAGTDGDGCEFYRHTGFEVHGAVRHYDDGDAVRYSCRRAFAQEV